MFIVPLALQKANLNMPRVLLVSNRVTDMTTANQAGGVSVVLADLMHDYEILWLGWNGIIESDDAAPLEFVADGTGRFTTALTTSEHKEYYLGYANSVIWPVFHSRLDLAQFDAGYFSQYRAVNRRFAAAIRSIILPDDVIWVHDYQLVPLAIELRDLGVTNSIGFFLHIPVPPSQALLAVPEHVELAHAMAAFDLFGVQTRQDVANLIEFFRHAVHGQLLPDGRMQVASRNFRVASFPIGIDNREFTSGSLCTRAEASHDIRIIGIDRLDYTKGLPQKFRAYASFLENNPIYRGRVTLTQIAPPTRETLEAYSDIRSELESLAGAINGKYGDLRWVPIYYMHRAINREDLKEIYASSRVGLVTPLRDGMNLVAKEYVAAQSASDPGTLILSRFAGAAEQLDAALIVNPYNTSEVAAAIKTAIEMPLDERIARHRDLLEIVVKLDSRDWADAFLESLSKSSDRTRDLQAQSLPIALIDMLDALKRTIGDGSFERRYHPGP